MKSQEITTRHGLMLLWSLLPFGKTKVSPYTDDAEAETCGQFKLYANYPNPFRTITIIYFSLMNISQVRIDIANEAGKTIMTLINGEFEPGVQRVPLYRVTNGITLKAGNYTYRLTVINSHGKFSQAKSITVL